MTRVKEVDPGSGDIPEYKSPANRLVHSLRQGYDNLRLKLKEARDTIKYYQIKDRDLDKSRNQWKEKSKEKEAKIEELEKQLKVLEKENTHLKEECKKKR